MRDLKEYIQFNRNLFDDECPAPGHIKRFEKRLDYFNNKKNKTNRLFFRISIAASLILVIGLGSYYFYLNKGFPNVVAQKEISDPFIITNEYFLEQMDNQISEIECKLVNVDNVVREQVVADLKNVVEENTLFVENIRNDLDEELAMMYLVRHYRSNIEALRLINNRLGIFVEC